MVTDPRCKWCSKKILGEVSIGRRRQYCGQACRQRAYEKRREQVGGLAVNADSVAVRRTELEHLQDRLYVLRCAVEELADALADKADADELAGVAKEVVAATGDLDKLWVTP